MDQDGGSLRDPQVEDMVHAAFLQRAVDALEHLFGSTVGERLATRLKGDALQLFLSPAVSTHSASLPKIAVPSLPPSLAHSAAFGSGYGTGSQAASHGSSGAGTSFGQSANYGQNGPARPRDASRFVSLDDTAGLLLAIDAALGDGSGSTLERVGQALGAHTFVAYQRDLEHAEHADVATWTRRLTAALLAPFPADSLVWKAIDRSDGLEVICHIPGHSGCARVLRHLTVGQVRAAFTFAMEATSADLRILAETLGDRFTLTARYRPQPARLDEYSTPPSTIRPVPAAPSDYPPPYAQSPYAQGAAESSYPPAAGSASSDSTALGAGGAATSGIPTAGHGQHGSSRPPYGNVTRSGRPPALRPSVAEHVNEILKRIPKRY
jgi:hypothetical protein